MDQRRYLNTLLLTALLGFPAAAAAVLLTVGLHQLDHLLWHTLPHEAGWDQPPGWLVIVLPALGGAMVLASLRLPGHGGHAAVDGLGFDPVPWQSLPSILLAAAGSISMGLVVGPEAPLVAIGLAVGGVAGLWLRRGEEERAILAFAGAFAAISTVFGGPLPATLLLFELIAISGRVPAAQLVRFLLPGFLAAGTGALVFTGVGDWGGVTAYQLAIPGLPAYPTVELADLLWCVPVAASAAAVSAFGLRGAHWLAGVAEPRPQAAVLIGGGAVVGLIAVLAQAISGAPTSHVLFSGSAALGPLLAENSAGVMLTVIVAKGLAFVVTVAARFRGGLIFPNVTLGFLIGLIAHDLGGPALTPAVVAGIAAAASATLRAPIFGALMAALLTGSAAVDLAPVAIIAATIGWLVASAIEGPAEDAATTGAVAEPARTNP